MNVEDDDFFEGNEKDLMDKNLQEKIDQGRETAAEYRVQAYDNDDDDDDQDD